MLGSLLLATDGLFEELCTAVLAIEGPQYRLRLGELDHPLAGQSGVVLEVVVGSLPQPCSQHEHAQQHRQGRQGNQSHLPVQGEQRDENHHRRNHTGQQWREHVCGQLRQFHHARGRQMAEPRRVLRAEPAYGQLRHMVAKAVTAALEHGDANADAGFFHAAPQRPARNHTNDQRDQPLRGGVGITTQQVGEDRHQHDNCHPAEQAIDQGHRQIAAQDRSVFAEQLNKGFQHDDTACSLACS